MTKLLVFLALVLTIYVVDARHVHPRSIVRVEEEGHKNEAILKIDGIPIEVIRNLVTNRFVPPNDIHFFKLCEDGFERDLLGVCREVWD